jgi:hypothetical protein
VKNVAICALAALTLLTGCAPAVAVEDTGANLQTFTLQPVPRDQRYVIAVPSFTVGAGSVKIGTVDLSKEGGDAFYRELGSGVADIFIAEAYES